MTTRFAFRMVYYKDCELFFRDNAIHSKNAEPPQLCHQTSYPEIVSRRGTVITTPCGQPINDFVALYFSPITAMAFTIHRGNVRLVTPEGKDIGAATMDDRVFFVCDPAKVAAAGLPIYFSDVACNSQAHPPTFETDLAKLETHVKWSLFDEAPAKAVIAEIGYQGVTGYFHDRDNPPEHKNRKHRRSAEFLVRDTLPLDLVECIIVKSAKIRDEVAAMMARHQRNIPIYVKPDCYF